MASGRWSRTATLSESPTTGEINQPLMEMFEPGSTNKLITLSTAIEEGVVGPDTIIDVPPEEIGNGERRIGLSDSLTEPPESGSRRRPL